MTASAERIDQPVPQGDEATANGLLALVSDVVLELDREGRVEAATAGPAWGWPALVQAWEGRLFVDTVARGDREAAAGLLAEGWTSGSAGPERLDHPTGGGRAAPMSYHAVRGRDEACLLVAGRDLGSVNAMRERLIETEQTMERDYRELRQAESRYRLLFELSNDALLVVDTGSAKVTDANAAAAALWETSPERLIGRPAISLCEPGARPGLRGLVARAALTDRAPGLRARLAVGERPEVSFSARPFRAGQSTSVLLQASRAGVRGREAEASDRLTALVEHIPDAMVLTDAEGNVLKANPAFLELVQLGGDDEALGRRLGEWIGYAGNDLAMILTLLKQHRTVRALETVARGEHGQTTGVELSAALVPESDDRLIGFVLRALARRTADEGSKSPLVPLAIEPLARLVGRVSLPDLVRETTDRVERHFIEAALALAGGNRTTAAEVLGLSRQSLYVKLRRHALGSSEA